MGMQWYNRYTPGVWRTEYTSGYKQKPKVDRRVWTPFVHWANELISCDSNSSSWACSVSGNWQGVSASKIAQNSVYGDSNRHMYFGPGSELSLAYNRAYDKLRGLVGDQAAWLTALAERKSTADMVLNRLTMLHKAAKHLRKGRFAEFLRTLGVKPLEKHKGMKHVRSKQFGGLWLEYWFGWAPTINDIYVGLEILNEKPVCASPQFKAGSKATWDNSTEQTSGYTRWIMAASGDVTVRLTVRCEVTNPALVQLSSLGLTNPALTIYEIIPFSWLFDWFTGVGLALRSATDWLGIEVRDVMISARQSESRHEYVWSTWAPYHASREIRSNWYQRFQDTGKLPPVKPVLVWPKLSETRGATLASLLAVLFLPDKDFGVTGKRL